MDASEPKSYGEASTCVNSATWHLAMESEINCISHNKSWDLVELLIIRCALLCKSVHGLKETSHSTTPKYKAKLVMKGFHHQYGINFDEIFSPTVKMATLRFLLNVVAVENLELIQLDVKTAFLYGDLAEEIYMDQLKGFVAACQ